jgi:hypothetical protein
LNLAYPPTPAPPRKILVASLLKPLDDPRMYEKMALTLAAAGHEVHVAGTTSPAGPPPVSGLPIQFHDLGPYGRPLRPRLARVSIYLRTLARVRPHAIIFSTPELILPTIWFKIRHFGQKISLFYDLRENYAYNLRHQAVYGRWKKTSLAWGIRALEMLSFPLVKKYILAEKTYWDEVPFVRPKAVVLENKFVAGWPTGQTDQNVGSGNQPNAAPGHRRPRLVAGQPLEFLYSGTVTRHYGTLEAVIFFHRLHEAYPASRLRVVGQCSDPAYARQVELAKAGQPYIELELSAEPVPHAQLVGAIRSADVGLLAYQPNPSTANCIPARLYEYLAHGLPMLVPPNPLWAGLLTQHHAGLAVDLQRANAAHLVQWLFDTDFYPQGAPAVAFWGKPERARLLELLD